MSNVYIIKIVTIYRKKNFYSLKPMNLQSITLCLSYLGVAVNAVNTVIVYNIQTLQIDTAVRAVFHCQNLQTKNALVVVKKNNES